MRKLGVFNFITLNGYFEGPGRDISWHKHDGEENEYSEKMSNLGNTLLFGRVTYELMASYWPTEYAMKNDPVVAEGMNKSEKIVFSRTLDKVEWRNTKLVKDNMVEEVRKMKQMSGKDMTILGSGSILTQLAEHDLIDEYIFMVDPIVLGQGTSIFKGLSHQLNLKLAEMHTLKSGIILLNYQSIERWIIQIKFNIQTSGLFVYVANADETYNKAIEAGASVKTVLSDQQYGRSGGVIDPFGNTWWITSVK
jgi:dihydrofolate reductase